MNLLVSAAIAIVFGSGLTLLLRRTHAGLVAGTIQISNAALLFLVFSASSLGTAPVHPIEPGQVPSDPIAQAITLTGIVINFAFSAVLLFLVRRSEAR